MAALCLPLEQLELQAFGEAFRRACDDLKLGPNSLDVSKQERVAHLILGFIRRGETNTEALRRRAILRFNNTPEPAS
jgi:hypothetical protein